MGVMDSPKIRIASRVLKIGIRFPNKTVLPAPNFEIARFQHQNAKTDVPIPKYKIEPIKALDQSIGSLTTICSMIKNGNSINEPNIKMMSKNDNALICMGFFLTKILYTANAKAPANIHASPLEKLNESNTSKLPLEISSTIPKMHSIIPMIL